MSTYDYAADSRPEYPVRVAWEDPHDTIHDAIKADSPEQALEAARANWPGATVTLADPEESPVSDDLRTQPPGSPMPLLLSQPARRFLAWWLAEDDPDTARTVKDGTVRLNAARIDALLEELKAPDNVAGHEEAVQDLRIARGELAELDAARSDIARMREIGWIRFRREVEDAQAAAGEEYTDGFGRVCQALGLTEEYRQGWRRRPTGDDVRERAGEFGLPDYP